MRSRAVPPSSLGDHEGRLRLLWFAPRVGPSGPLVVDEAGLLGVGHPWSRTPSPTKVGATRTFWKVPKPSRALRDNPGTFGNFSVSSEIFPEPL